jgi:hypothetical protein
LLGERLLAQPKAKLPTDHIEKINTKTKANNKNLFRVINLRILKEKVIRIVNWTERLF